MTTEQIVLASRPKGLPVGTDFRMTQVELPEIKAGELLLKGLYYSVDPYMRGRMNDAKSYAPPFEIDKPIYGGVVAKVMESKSDQYKAGDLVVGNFPWQKDFIATEKEARKIDATLAPPSYYLGVLGMTGLTAYFGLMHIGKPKAGETVVVSGAAGAVGIVVGQIAKIQGCRVVGIAGSDEKTKLLTTEFGFDAAINYKTASDMNKAIAAACPNGVDVYFDNVGGEISDAVIKNINFHARIPLCGQISLYNATEAPMGPRIQPILLTRSVLMQGFIVGNFQEQFPEGMQHLAQWIRKGKLKTTETIEHGFENLPNALLGLFKGENTGKMIVEA
ncbi:NADP-dependent oxidoreductase [Paracnuella aquatica]|uniref:NADP-dependent oxidoreductase n=1 Tax=Paracnuella aquatica TaxID=2268757 RepID=UPI000DEFDDBC|nr:NADP-dependent oxidoreductase [Paracnuella aquatica]RPD51581.1 NADP-dependent oxidoreductase [Paracnuella aquatica]